MKKRQNERNKRQERKQRSDMEVVQISHKEYLKIDRNYEKAARVADLIYVNDKTDNGIQRIKKGKGFTYIYDSKPLRDKAQIERIRKLAIPPAWTNVWICPKKNGHIQATGFDVRKRKQYRYHTMWHTVRNETKFHRLYEFGKCLPALRLRIEEDLAKRELTQEKVIATVISLMERTYIRSGNNGYEKMYGSYGLTTLKDQHVDISGDKLKFSFKGKKGIYHNVTIKSKRLARIVQKCKEMPGKELFQYLNDKDEKCTIDSGCVNEYIKEATGGDFSAKDFRTWAGSLNILRALRSVGEAGSESDCKKKIAEAIDEVSKKLGNSRTICKKYYIHPGLIRLYEEKNLDKYLKELDDIEEPDQKTDHTKDEKVLMKILLTFIK